MSNKNKEAKVVEIGDPLIGDAMRKVSKIPVKEKYLYAYWKMRSEKLGYDVASKYHSARNSVAVTSQALHYFLNNFEEIIPETGQRGSFEGYYFYLYGAFNAAYVQQDGLNYIYSLSTDNKKAYEVHERSAWSEIRDLRAAGFAHPINYKSEGKPNFVTMMYFGGLVMSVHDDIYNKTEKIPVTQPTDFLKLFSEFRHESVECLQQCAIELDKLKDVVLRKLQK